MRVLVADDHPPTRAGVRMALEANGFEVCAEVGDAGSAIEAARRELPDVCLLDIHMPGDGIHAAEAISRELPGQRILTLEHPVQGERQPRRIDVLEEIAGRAGAQRIEEIRVGARLLPPSERAPGRRARRCFARSSLQSRDATRRARARPQTRVV